MSDWSVVTVAKENLQVMMKFVAWHLSQGAAKIHIMFDDPDDPCISVLSEVPSVQVTRCTPEFWSSIGSRASTHFTRRQSAAFASGYRAISSGWVLCMDADELMWIREGTISSFLDRQPAEVRGILVRTAERVRVPTVTSGDTFRFPISRRLMRKVHGNFSQYLLGTHGIVGHKSGKSFTRAGLDISRGHPHWMVDPENRRIIDKIEGLSTGMALLHYYESGYDDWRNKLSYRVGAVSRRRRNAVLGRLRELVDSKDEDGLRDFYAKLHELNAYQVGVLRKHGGLLNLEVEFDELVREYFPGREGSDRVAQSG